MPTSCARPVRAVAPPRGHRRPRRNRGSGARSSRHTAKTFGPCIPPARAVAAARYKSRPATPRRSRSRAQEAAHHLERRRLAGAIWSQQAEDLAAIDPEGNPLGGREISELLGQLVYLNDRRRIFGWSTGRPASGAGSFGPPPSKSTNASSNRGGVGLISISASARSLGVGGPAPSLVTSRTELPWMTPSRMLGC